MRRLTSDIARWPASWALDEAGEALLEYSILIALIATVCFGLVLALGIAVLDLYDSFLAAFP